MEQLKKGLFQQNRIYKYQLTPQKLLEDLQSIRNKLISLNSKDKIIESALRIVRKKLYSQTASIFLHSKDGLYYRVKIDGVDASGNTIQNKWFAEESYSPGESFTGKAVLPGKNGYGQPQLSNNLNESEVNKQSKVEYENQLYLDEVVGTLSVYTGYEYDFHPSCQIFLDKVSSLIAAFIGRIKEKKKEQNKYIYIKEQILPTLPQNKQQEAAKELDAFDSNINVVKHSENSTNDNFATSNMPD